MKLYIKYLPQLKTLPRFTLDCVFKSSKQYIDNICDAPCQNKTCLQYEILSYGVIEK